MCINKEIEMKKQRGFTLVEIMIVVAIVAILSAVALPAYTSYMARGKLVDAQSALTSGRVSMEQYYQDHRAYNATGTPCAAGWPAATTYFTYGCAATSTTFTITATSAANQGLGAAGSYVYTINESNTKATTAFPGGKTSATTWISK
jgi:type IV pilus assembly protein PilE